jgi:hypothetical protein
MKTIGIQISLSLYYTLKELCDGQSVAELAEQLLTAAIVKAKVPVATWPPAMERRTSPFPNSKRT